MVQDRNMKIYQACLGEGAQPVEWLFMDYEWATRHGWDAAAYEFVYESDMVLDEDDIVALDQLFVIFNTVQCPDDYYGRSLSVSDVVVLDGASYFVDSFGFLPIDFDPISY